MSSDSFPVAVAALHLGLHNMMTFAKQGHISPQEVDVALSGVTETLENLDAQVVAKMMIHLDPLFANLKRTAANNWKSE